MTSGYMARMVFRPFLCLFLLGAVSLTAATNAVAQSSACFEGPEICDWLDRIAGVRTSTTTATVSLLDNGLMVTNKHVVEDHELVAVRLPDGTVVDAYPLPNDHPADLVFLGKKKDQALPSEIPNGAEPAGLLRIVGFDRGRNASRAYVPGDIIALPPRDKPQARIHIRARSVPGNSGGVVLDNAGQVVGFMTSGDGVLSEAVPVSLLDDVAARTSPEHSTAYYARGKAMRLCADAMELAQQLQADPPPPLVTKIEENCSASNNKLLLESAGQAFGRWGILDRAEDYLLQSLDLDPNSPNTLMSMAIVHHFQRDYAREKPILEQLLALTPENPQALRLAIQTAGFLKDRAFADSTLLLMEKHNPNALPLAKQFLENQFSVQ